MRDLMSPLGGFRSPFGTTLGGVNVSIGAGFAITGVELTATVGGLSGSETVTYQWQADGVNVGGATASTFTPTIATNVADEDVLTCDVTVNGDVYTSNNRIAAYAAGSVTASALAGWTIDDTALNLNLASDFTTTNLSGTYVITGLPSGAVDDGDGTVSGTPDGTPETAAVVATFTDQYGRKIIGDYPVAVAYRAQATAANGLGPFSVTVDDAAISINFVADFTANGNTLSYTIAGLPAGGVDDGDGTASGTPTAVSSGSVVCTGTDEYGRATTSTATLTTALRTQATAAGGLGPYSFAQDVAISSQNVAADFTLNGNTLTYAVSPALPTTLAVATNGIMSGTPADVTASATYTVTGQDEYGRDTPSAFALEITDIPANAIRDRAGALIADRAGANILARA